MLRSKTTKILALALILGTLGALTYQIYTQYMISYIKSGSMEPTYNRGDIVIIKRVDPKKISTGDVIVFRDPRDPKILILHRVVAIREQSGVRYFLTKGDNPDTNPYVDAWGWVREDYVLGVLVGRIPYLGYIFLMFDEPSARFLMILLGIVLILIYLMSGVEQRVQVAPISQYLRDRRVTLVCVILLLLAISLLYTSNYTVGRRYWNVEVISRGLNAIDGDYYVTLKLNITSKISGLESINKIEIQIFVGGECVGFGVWNVVYPFYGTKIVSIAIFVGSKVESLEEVTMRISVVIFDYMRGSSMKVPVY